MQLITENFRQLPKRAGVASIMGSWVGWSTSPNYAPVEEAYTGRVLQPHEKIHRNFKYRVVKPALILHRWQINLLYLITSNEAEQILKEFRVASATNN